jgi:F420-dependent oxidoreductase-like protein
MELRIFTEPQQGATYDDVLAVAKAAEELGFDAFFRSDHYMVMGDGDGLPGPSDAWTTLAGLARDTSRIRLGTLVSSVTYRYPGILAIQVAQVDQMSGGRVELGLGTGWFEREHQAYGIPFPAKRFGMLTEQLEIVTGLWSTPVGETFNHSGEHYTLVDSPALPKPTQARIPIIVGGSGPRRTPAIAARFADEFNVVFPDADAVDTRLSVIRAALDEAGRDHSTMTLSVAHILCAAADDVGVKRRADAIGWDVEQMRANGFAGTASEVVDKLGALQDKGVTRVYLQVLDLHDLDHLEFVAAEIAPQLR